MELYGTVVVLESEKKIEAIDEINKIIRQLATDYKMSETSVKKILETSLRRVFAKKGKVVSFFTLETRKIYGYDKREGRDSNKFREWNLSNNDYKIIAEETRKELEKTFEKNALKNEKNLLEKLIEVELRGNRVVRCSIVGITEDKQNVVFKFKKKDGTIKESPQFYVSFNNFLKEDQIKLGNTFSLWVSDVIFKKSEKKTIAFRATRKNQAVFEDELFTIFKLLLGHLKNDNSYSDEQIAFLTSSIISQKNNMGNFFCKVKGDSLGLSRRFYGEVTRLYKNRLGRKFVWKEVNK